MADPNDGSEWNTLSMVENHFGARPKFYFVFSKKISTKNKNSTFGVLVYPEAMGRMASRAPDEQIIASARQRFNDQYGGELKYDDDFLRRYINEVRNSGAHFESYNSKNSMVLPSQLKQYLGEELYGKIIFS